MSDLHNRTYDEIELGASVSVSRTLTPMDIELLTLAAGDVDSYELDAAAGASSPRIAHAAEAVGLGVLISGLLNRRLPGPGTTVLALNLVFGKPALAGDRITTTVNVVQKLPEGLRVTFDCRCVNQHDEVLVNGQGTVRAPSQRLNYTELATPELILRRGDRFAQLIARCAQLPALRCAVVHPCDEASLQGAVLSAQNGLIAPVLVGPQVKMQGIAKQAGIDLSACTIVDVPHSHAAAARAVALARAGQVDALMKGSLHTDELMAEVMASETGLRTGRRISHVFVMDVPAYPRLLLITDAAINIHPTLEDKVDIVQNAIGLARRLGVDVPKVAIVSAVETINPKIASTLDAAALCKMAERGQITGGLLDGPLAFDNAINLQAARDKHIVSAVAGQADVLLVPDLEAGNMLAKQLQYLAGASSAGVVLGARVPIALTSRADSARTRLVSAAVMALSFSR